MCRTLHGFSQSSEHFWYLQGPCLLSIFSSSFSCSTVQHTPSPLNLVLFLQAIMIFSTSRLLHILFLLIRMLFIPLSLLIPDRLTAARTSGLPRNLLSSPRTGWRVPSVYSYGTLSFFHHILHYTIDTFFIFGGLPAGPEVQSEQGQHELCHFFILNSEHSAYYMVGDQYMCIE